MHSGLPIVALRCKTTPRDRKSHTWAPFPVNKIIYQRQTTSAQFAAAVYCVEKSFIALTFVTITSTINYPFRDACRTRHQLMIFLKYN
jgi:hypothetical protein